MVVIMTDEELKQVIDSMHITTIQWEVVRSVPFWWLCFTDDASPSVIAMAAGPCCPPELPCDDDDDPDTGEDD